MKGYYCTFIIAKWIWLEFVFVPKSKT